MTNAEFARFVASNPDWRRDQSYSAGGILRDHGPHAIYLLLSLLGQQPRDVSVVTGSLARSRPNGCTTEDTALLRLRCDEGAECEVSLTWAAGHRSSRYLFAGTDTQTNPYDINGIKNALEQAAQAPPAVRARKMRAMRRTVRRHDVAAWADKFLADLEGAHG